MAYLPFSALWGGWQMPSRGPPRCGISWNAYQICHHESNHCYSFWMCSAWGGSHNALHRARQQKCCRRRPTTQHTPVEHRGLRGSLQTWSALLSSQLIRTRLLSSSYRRPTAQLSCPTYGRFQHLRVTISPSPSGRRSLLLPSDAWSQESLREWITSSWSLYSTTGRLSNLGFSTPLLPACANSKFQYLGKSICCCNS